MNEVFKNSVFRWREIEILTATTNRLLNGIQFQIRYDQHRSRCTLRSSYESFDPREQFSQIERLAEVVIGSGIQQIHNCFFAFLCRENEDRGMQFLPTQVLKDTLTALEGKHQIKHDRVINVLLSEVRTCFSVGGMVHGQSGFAQRSNNVLSQPLLVFDEEYAHDMTT